MRIALLPSSFAPAVGGVEVLTARLALHLHARGHSVKVWTSGAGEGGLPDSEEVGGVSVSRFAFTLPRADPGSMLTFPAGALSTFGRMRSEAQKFRPDLLHVQCFSGNGAYATGLSYLTGTPLVVTLQGETVMDDHDIYERSTTLKMALRLGLRRAARVTGCSAFALSDARVRFGLDMSKASVIFNGVDVDESPATPIPLPYERYVLGLGRVVKKKGFDLLIDAFSRVSTSYPDLGLIIAGDGTEREALRALAHSLGLGERVYLPGKLSRGEVEAVMRGAEVFVMPSRVEPFGMVALEAWRAGVATVATSRGGAPEFVQDGVSGLIADPFEASRLASALDSLLASPELRGRLADAGRRELARFTWARLAEQYEAVYKMALAHQ